MIEEKMFKKVSIFIALLILAVLSVFIIWPLLVPIIIGLLLAYVFYPVYKKILFYVRIKTISSLIVILIVILIIFVPLWFIIPLLLKQIFNIYLYLQHINLSDFFKDIFPSKELSQSFASSINTFIANAIKKILSIASDFILDLPNLVLKAVVVLFVFFFAMRDGEAFKSYIMSLSPFSKSVEKEFIKKFKEITNSVIFGQIIIGIIQGFVTGIGLLIFGVPNILTLTIIAMLTSIIPLIGAWLVWLPASIYLITTNKLVYGIGLFLYGSLFVSWVDNFLRPYIIARRSKISAAVILVGMIGGLIVFGILGLVIGPLVLAYLLLILDAYRKKKFFGIAF